MGVLDNLEPKRVFYYFEEISKIPHGSGNTDAMSDFVVNFAKEKKLKHRRDEKGNVLIVKDASAGYEASDTVMLQGHMDMVCEKNSDAVFDFKKDPLKLCVMDDCIFARGTTLGGDDAIAVAYMLALLEDDELEAPRLECVFTVDEEIGMGGAKAFDVSDIRAKTLINLDHEDEGLFLTSCAGGLRAQLTVPVRFKEKAGEKYTIVVCGLKGGHSGTEIHKYLANANILIGRLMHYLGTRVKYSVISLGGGMQDNAIPREASMDVLVQEEDISNFEDIIDEFQDIIRNEYRSLEKNIQIYCNDKGLTACQALTQKTQERVIFLLNTMPDGVQKMSPDIHDLVQTSLNLGIIRLDSKQFKATSALRSSVKSEIDALSDKLRYLTETIGGTYEEHGEYPAWEYNPDSRVQKLVKETYDRLFDEEGTLTGVHAGLECGIFARKLPGIDIVAFGPDVLHIHSPKERMSVPSTERVYRLLRELLKVLK
ncbi:MAG: aminoacyl-histidine dipeptidase [Lachnospiraceae bacterium]|nr:aminoacyl-histidine dipeptidase [Lachnospiraceae bacterium]